VGFVRGILRGNVTETVKPMIQNFTHVVIQKDVFDESMDVFGIDKGKPGHNPSFFSSFFSVVHTEVAYSATQKGKNAFDKTVKEGKEVLSSAGRAMKIRSDKEEVGGDEDDIP